MAVTSKRYAGQALGQWSATAARRIDWLTDTIKCMLCTVTYVPNQTTHVFRSSVTNEITGTGYTAGGVTLGSKTSALSGLALQNDAADAVWTASTLTARVAVVYKDTAAAATDPLIGYVDFGADAVTSAGTLTVTWDVTGVVVDTVA